MDRLTRWIFLFLGANLTLFLLLILNFELVPIRTYGVKQFIWGSGGIVQEDFPTGYHLGITGIHKWHLLDSSTHFLEFTESPERDLSGPGNRFGFLPKSGVPGDFQTPVRKRYPALEIRNRDGNIVTIDASVPYRIIPGQAWRIVADGAKITYQDRVKATVESVLREVLPEMSNEAFQDTGKRLENAQKALDALNKGLRQFHVEADAVLIRRVAFPPEYEAKLQQKQLFTQKALLDQAETLKLGEVQRTGTVEKEIAAAESLSMAEWSKKMETLRADYALQVATINAEALQYSKRGMAEGESAYQEKIAQGKLALDLAEALLTQLRSEALATAGGQIYVARLAAENLNLGRVTLNASDHRLPLLIDIHKIAELLIGATALPGPGPSAGPAPASGPVSGPASGPVPALRAADAR